MNAQIIQSTLLIFIFAISGILNPTRNYKQLPPKANIFKIEPNRVDSRKIQTNNSFLGMEFDKIIAYDFHNDNAMHVDSHGMWSSGGASKETILNTDQTTFIVNVLEDTATFGGFMMRCFDPHLGLKFYKGNKVLADISICFECNQLASSIANSEGKRNFGGGFSAIGRQKLDSFCKQLEFSHCSEK